MNILVSVSNCTDGGLRSIMSFVKNSLTIIQIIVPILLIVMASIRIAQVVKNPDDKKAVGKIKTTVLAAIIVFFIPVFVNVLMYALGSTTELSSCWNNSSTSTSSGYMDPDEGKTKQKVYTDPGDYQ